MPTGIYERKPCAKGCSCGRHRQRTLSPETRAKLSAAQRGVVERHPATCGCFRCRYAGVSEGTRFDAKVVVQSGSGCHIWIGGRDSLGYGNFRSNGRLEKAHRVAYRRTFGEIQPGLELDHICRVRHCVNPAHLEPVTHAENMHRAAASGSLVVAQRRRRAQEAAECR